MQLTSQLTYSELNNKPIIYNQNYYLDNYTVPYIEKFTEYLVGCPTRYSPVTYCYRGDNIIGLSLMHYGEYTEMECNLLRNFINDSTIVYDIGSNIGVHTQAFAKTAKHVYSFEPNNNNYKLLEINTYHDKNVSLYKYALSDSVGIAKIEQYELGSIGNFGECKLTDVGQDCKMTTIDELVNTRQIEPPHVIKIDVEGHEQNVFRGMRETIKHNLPVIFYEAMHCDLISIYDMLNQFGYELYWYPVNNYNPNNFYKNKNNIFGHGGVLNILAVPFHIQCNTNLPKVLDRDDTWHNAFHRLQKTDAKSD